jgi:lysine 2,3-aminomutase
MALAHTASQDVSSCCSNKLLDAIRQRFPAAVSADPSLAAPKLNDTASTALSAVRPSILPSVVEPDMPIGRPFESDVSKPHWQDWKWQFRNRVKSAPELRSYLQLTADESAAFTMGGYNLPFAITPYYLRLLANDNPLDPLRKTVVPQTAEFNSMASEYDDPCGEDGDMVAPGLVHRYPDRVLLLVNETCSVYCRYCTRSRLVGSGEHEVNLEAAYAYLEANSQVRDVLLSGGDPLVMDDPKLERILARLRAIPSIKVLRIGTKVPTVMPQRITPELVAMLKRYAPLYMSIHFTHPNEITPEVETACNLLADNGIMTFSQTVLMKGVNDDPGVMKTLMQQILELRVRPYYLYQCDPVKGTSHFRAPVSKGLEIMEHLRGHITGYAVPTYVIDGPGGGGKIPISPNYIESMDQDRLVLRNYKNERFEYVNVT